jgi:FAD/FMN-containing dehydrogenase
MSIQLKKYAWVEPGIVRDELNQSLSEYRLHFAPDPATSSRATVGGMIANNSSGTRSILYGKTIDHVLELEVILITGEVILCKNLQHSELETKCQLQNKEGEIYRSVVSIVANNEEEIVTHFPKVMRRVGGYNLDEFLGAEFNLCKLICGSESTLGIITKAKINLEPLPRNQAICAVHYHDFF